ncbi:MAG: T9SS type A sorting domain-containing protein [Bacteroidota bacterium]
MKKLYFVLITVMFTCNLLAQQTATNETFRFDGYAPIDQNALLQKQHHRATKEMPIGWMIPSWNLLDYFYLSNSMVTHYANLIFPDSTVVYESGGVTMHNWLNSVGGVFDPYSPMYDSTQNAPLIPSSDPYRIDSVFVLAWYNVVNSAVKDTLVLEIENGAPTVAPEFAWTTFSYPTDTFDVSPPKIMGSSTEKGYLCRMTASTKTVIKYPLTLSDSTNVYGKYITIPVHYDVPAGKVAGISITFVPGTSYNYGDMLFSYSHTSTPSLNSIRMGLYSTTNTTTDPHVFAEPYLRWTSHHYINTNVRYSKYTGTSAWRNERMVSTMSWGFDLGYYITNASSIGISEPTVYETLIWPNPSKGWLNIDNTESGSRVRLLDILGNCLIDKLTDVNGLSLDLRIYKNGLYFIEISKGENRRTSKIVLSR